MLKMENKKGQVFSQLSALGIGIATLVIILAVTFLVMAETGEQAAVLAGTTTLAACNSTACNATSTLTVATATIPDWVPLIVLVAIGGLILSLVAAFGRR